MSRHLRENVCSNHPFYSFYSNSEFLAEFHVINFREVLCRCLLYELNLTVEGYKLIEVEWSNLNTYGYLYKQTNKNSSILRIWRQNDFFFCFWIVN